MANIAKALHYACRTSKQSFPIAYVDGQLRVERPYVPDDKVSFSIEWKDYKPSEYTSKIVLSNPPWADPVKTDGIKWNEIDNNVDRRSFLGNYKIDSNGYPLNPIGRTGIVGRGLLGKWGPNHAADPIVTRWKRDKSGDICKHTESGKPILQFVSIRRIDTKEWAIPGGMCDPGENISLTLKREFMEEAIDSGRKSAEKNKEIENTLKSFFEKGVQVYSGYVDDPRNTDNAWMETVAYHFHDADDTHMKGLKLTAGDDAGKVKWMDIRKDLELYANHIDFIQAVTKSHNAHW